MSMSSNERRGRCSADTAATHTATATHTDTALVSADAWGGELYCPLRYLAKGCAPPGHVTRTSE